MSDSVPASASSLAFFAGGGECGAYLRGLDWSKTRLGPPESWPQGLKTSLRMALTTRHPMFIFWGDDLLCFYNDAYSASLGPEKHPSMLGSPVREAFPEIWDVAGPQIALVMRGEGATWYENQLVPIVRFGEMREAYWTYSYGPIDDPSSPTGVGGVLVVVSETTAQVLAERRRVEESERLRAMFHQAPGFIALMDGPEHRFSLTNAAYQELVGHRQVIGKTVLEALPEVREQGYIDLLDKVFSTGEPYIGSNQEVFFQNEQTGQTETRFVDFVYQPIRDAQGVITGVFLQGADVTERFAAQLDLREETRSLEALNHAAATLGRELDLEKVVQTVTDAGVDITGAQFGAFFYNVIDDDGKSYLLYALSGAARSEFSNFPMPRITQLFEPTFRGEGVIRSADILTDPRYGKSEPYKGMPKGHLPVRSYLAVPVASHSERVIGVLFFGHREPNRFSERDERLSLGIAAQAAIAIENARLFQDAQREIADRQRAEHELKELNETLEARVQQEVAERAQVEEALRQSQKMEAVGQLTGGIAHDFNNLLQVISGNLQLLAGDVVGNPRSEARVQNAMSGVSRGSKLAAQLLAFGRRQALAPKVVNIGRFIRDTDALIRRALGETIEVETIVAGGLWNTLIDPSNVENAVLNLAINARDAMGGNGKLTIEVGNASLDQDYVLIHPEAAPGQYVMLAVSDTGCGMTPEVMAKAFDPFFTTKPVGQGTGLGLSMVYGFVKQSGGYIKIYSELGQGTTVKLYLPRSVQAEDVLVTMDAGPVTGGNETILVAEDDEAVRETVVSILADLGYRVLQARDAQSALSIIESGIHVDLLFTDVVMPGAMKSPDMARKAQLRLPNMAVLFTSGYTENAIVHGGRLDQGVELLGKPYTREALARKLRHVFANRAQRISAHSAASAQASAMLDRKAPRELTILVCEDDHLIRGIVAEMLAARGHTVLEASDGEQALAIHAARPADVLLTDVSLPGMSGDQLAKHLRAVTPSLPVVYATGHGHVLGELDQRSAVVTKPYGSETLLNTIYTLVS